MSRRVRNLALYVGVIGLGVVIAALIGWGVGFEPVGFLLVAALLLIPGWIARRVLADLFVSRMLLDQGRVAEAESAAERAVESLTAQPWRGLFLYAQFGFYTRDARAMALNNLGAARMRRGALDLAEADLRAALARDPGYGVATYNLAVLHAARDDRLSAERLFREAEAQGYTGGPADQLISKVSAAYARFAAG